MATVKPLMLPRIGRAPIDNKTAGFEKRLQSPALQETLFLQMLQLEHRRSERFARPFLLVLISAEHYSGPESRGLVLQRVSAAIAVSTRETDIVGWYEQGSKLGILFTEIGGADGATVDLLTQKVSDALRSAVGESSSDYFKLDFRLYTQVPAPPKPHSRDADLLFHPDLAGWCR